MNKKCGYVALLGRPNAGKSTLLNAILNTKLAVVSNKPQTTRNKILGVCTQGHAQALFLDTPGIHRTQGLPRMNKMMNQCAWAVLRDANFVCYLIDVTAGWTKEDEDWLSSIFEKFTGKVLVLVSKSDKIKSEDVKTQLANISKEINSITENLKLEEKLKCELILAAPHVTSSKRPEEVTLLKELVMSHLPEAEWLYAEDDITDRPQKFICAELIREQVFRQLGQELPYKIAVVIDKFNHKKDITRIFASIIVERDSQKGIVLGKNGVRVKSIGTEARIALERHLDRKVFLEIFVKVKSGWTDDPNMLHEFVNLQETIDAVAKFSDHEILL